MAMTLRLPAELDEALTAMAERKGLSKQQLLVQAAEQYLRDLDHAAKVRALAAKAAADYPETLRRLGE